MAAVIIDAGPLYAMLDWREEHHSWTLQQLKLLRPPFLTCDAVLTEAFFLLADENPRGGGQLADYLRKNFITPQFDSRKDISRVLDLMKTYHDVPMSFADACLVCMVEDHPGASIFTLDHDFSVYRQHRRRLIPLIAPFQR